MTRYATQGSFRSGRIVPGPWPPRQGLRPAGVAPEGSAGGGACQGRAGTRRPRPVATGHREGDPRPYATRASTARDPASPPNPEETAIAAVVSKRVRVAVEELPASQRTAVLLAYFEGRTFRQVARLTGVPEGTAKSRLRLGLRRIADRLESEGLDGEW
jgi:RNA polymerase sigma factor (sigma-70 family)